MKILIIEVWISDFLVPTVCHGTVVTIYCTKENNFVYELASCSCLVDEVECTSDTMVYGHI